MLNDSCSNLRYVKLHCILDPSLTGKFTVSPNTHFDDLSALLSRLEVPVSASEAHGLLCGLLSAQPSAMAKRVWLTELLDAAALAPGSLSGRVEELKALDTWFSQVLESLNDSDLNFNPLLPEDNTDLRERTRALGDFCAGFCYGIGLGTAGRANARLPEDTAELISDFNEIDSTASSNIDDADEETLIELCEYVRVGVLLISEELQPVTATENRIH